MLLVVDGLGWEQLRARAGLAPTLSAAEGIDRPITSVAPTTTACALTSITTGRRPSEHGVLGYRLADGDEILNVLRWTIGQRRPARRPEVRAGPGFQPYPPFPGSADPVPVVSKDEFGSTGFTAAHLGDSPLHGYKVPSSLPVEVGRLPRAGATRSSTPTTTASTRWPTATGSGTTTTPSCGPWTGWSADLVAELPPGAVLVVTADHGQIDVGSRLELLGREIMPRCGSSPARAGSAGCTPGRGATEDLVAAATERYGTRPGS